LGDSRAKSEAKRGGNIYYTTICLGYCSLVADRMNIYYKTGI